MNAPIPGLLVGLALLLGCSSAPPLVESTTNEKSPSNSWQARRDAYWPLKTSRWSVTRSGPKTMTVFENGEQRRVMAFDHLLGGALINPNPAHPLIALNTGDVIKDGGEAQFMGGHQWVVNLESGVRAAVETGMPCGPRSEDVMHQNIVWSPAGDLTALCFGSEVSVGATTKVFEVLAEKETYVVMQAPACCAAGPIRRAQWISDGVLRYVAGCCGSEFTYEYDAATGARSQISVVHDVQGKHAR